MKPFILSPLSTSIFVIAVEKPCGEAETAGGSGNRSDVPASGVV